MDFFKKLDFKFEGVTFKHQNNVLRFHLFAYPLMSIVLMLWADFKKIIKHGFNYLLQDRVSLSLSIAIIISVVLSTSSSVMLHKSFKKKNLLLLRIYTAIYFSSVIINSTLYAYKNYQDTLKERRSFILIFASLVYIIQYIVDGTTLLIATEQFRIYQGFPIRTKIFGVSIENLLYCDVAFTWVACIYMAVVYYGSVSILKDPELLRNVISEWPLFVGHKLSFIANGINGILLWISIKQKSSKCLKYFIFIKVILIAIFGTIWIFVNRAVIKVYGKPLDPWNKIMPIFATLLFIANLFLLDCLLKRFVNQERFRQDPNAIYQCGTGNTIWKISEKLMKFKNIPWVKVTLDKGGQLGSGYFADVWKGTLHQKDKCSKTKVSVAVKMLRNSNFLSSSENNLDEVISEIKFLNAFKNAHENLVTFFGITSHLGGIGIVLEYCSSSTLQLCLRNKKNSLLFPHDIKRPDIIKLQNWAVQVASALDFLAKKNIIHGDVATRNVLLDEYEIAKVTDFGSSIHLYNYQFYAQSKQSVFPWRWMAPEVLADLKFSLASDVWSYGVLLWEIYTFGEIPWQGLEWTSDLVTNLKSGKYYLEKPPFASQKIYKDILCKCQQFEEESRLRFWEILKIFESITSCNEMSQNSFRNTVYSNEVGGRKKSSTECPHEPNASRSNDHCENNYVL